MKTFFTILFFSALINANSQVYSCKKPIIVDGQVYNVVVKISEEGGQINSVAANFYWLCPQQTNYADYERSGGFGFTKKLFTVVANEKGVLQVSSESGSNSDPLKKFSRCIAKTSGGDLKLLFTNGTKSGSIEAEFAKGASDDLSEGPDINGYIDAEYVKYVTSTADLHADAKGALKLQPNFSPFLSCSIDEKEFPRNDALRTFLRRNEDFVFKMNMDLYLDMVRYKVNRYSYSKEHFINFLRTHDLKFFQYELDDKLLDKKIEACSKLLSEASEKINLGDIFYKDFKISVDQVNGATNVFNLLNTEESDDYYGTKRIKGARDEYYKENALSIFLSNWQLLSKLELKEIDSAALVKSIRDGAKELTMRVYFLIQPYPAIAGDGEFRGVIAYGLKAVLFKNCSSQVIATINNKTVNLISEPTVKRCYNNGCSYLGDALKHCILNKNINSNKLYEDGYKELGQVRTPLKNCDEGFAFLSATVKKAANDDRIISFRLMTNYDCTLQPGYEVSFLDRNTGSAIKLPVINTSILHDKSSGGYYTIDVLVDKASFDKVLNSGLNSVKFQAVGEPVYLIPHQYFYYNPNDVVSEKVDAISIAIDSEPGADGSILKGMLKKTM